jgi:transcriptional regulator with XRE-family HTH domain
MTDDVRPQRDVDPVRKQIGKNVRAELVRLGLSQDDLAEMVGISQPQISKRLSGQIGFEAAELVRIADLLKIPAARLVEVAPETVAA